MENIFWLIDKQLAGRSGPDLDAWDLRQLHAGGIRAVLSVNAGMLCDPDEFRALEIDYACIAMPDKAPPHPGDDDVCYAALPQTYEFISTRLRDDRPVMVHCTAGKDRTGMTMAYYLMREQGLDPDAAIARVREVRPIALSAEGWEAMGRRVLERLHRESDR